MPLFKAERGRALGAECRQLALAAESKIEKTFLTNLAFSWNRLANQTDRYVEFLRNSRIGVSRDGLQYEAQRLGPPLKVGEDAVAILLLIVVGARIAVARAVPERVVE